MSSKLPQKLRDQIEIYRKAGFMPKSIESRKGSHWMVVFERVGPMILTTNVGDPRAIKNNLSELRRRAARQVPTGAGAPSLMPAH